MGKDLVRELINAGVHFGHGASRWNPKMAPYIFARRGKVHIIDVKQTIKSLLIAKKLLISVVSSGKDVVFVGTKRQAQKAVEAAAAACQMHYVSNRWLGGTLTNFRTIRAQLQRLEELETIQETGKFESESKKHASRLKRELRKLKGNLEGIRKMTQLPGTVVVVDGTKEYIALAEARKLGIPTIGIVDTDADPDKVDVVIPANDDSIRTIGLLLNELAAAVAEGKATAPAARPAVQHFKRPRSRSVLARADESGPVSTEQEQSQSIGTPAYDVPEAAAEEQEDQNQTNESQNH